MHVAKLLKVKEPYGSRVVKAAEWYQWRADHCSTHITYEHLNPRSRTDATHLSGLHKLLRITGHLTAIRSTLFWGTRMHFSLKNPPVCMCVCVCVSVSEFYRPSSSPTPCLSPACQTARTSPAQSGTQVPTFRRNLQSYKSCACQTNFTYI